jgi:hypothetical protein
MLSLSPLHSIFLRLLQRPRGSPGGSGDEDGEEEEELDAEERALKAQEDRDLDRAILESEKERDVIQVGTEDAVVRVISVSLYAVLVCTVCMVASAASAQAGLVSETSFDSRAGCPGDRQS